jgi:hypothetical protein
MRATPGLSRADQCRDLGLQVGDTIRWRTVWQNGYWSEAELTLFWLGNDAAVFRVRERSMRKREWSDPHESCAWSLEFRDWRKV